MSTALSGIQPIDMKTCHTAHIRIQDPSAVFAYPDHEVSKAIDTVGGLDIFYLINDSYTSLPHIPISLKTTYSKPETHGVRFYRDRIFWADRVPVN